MIDTGEPYLEAIRRTLGRIDLDPLSDPRTNGVVQAKRFFTETFSASLTRSWGGVTCGCPQRVFLHCSPRGRMTERYLDMLFDQIDKGNVLAAIALLDADHTHMRWFQRVLGLTLCFTDHYIETPIFSGSVFAYHGPRPEVFHREFEHFGTVVHQATKMPVTIGRATIRSA